MIVKEEEEGKAPSFFLALLWCLSLFSNAASLSLAGGGETISHPFYVRDPPFCPCRIVIFSFWSLTWCIF
jgi:hypothetical protein